MAVLASVFFVGASIADAYFLSDPAQQGNGITSIGTDFFDANDFNSVSPNISNPGDSSDVYVFVDYQNGADYTLTGVRGYVTYVESDSSITFTGRLSASNASDRTDTARLTNLPDRYELEFIEARAQNNHSTTHFAKCGSGYDYNSVINNVVRSGGTSLSDLDTRGVSSTNGETGACDQGHMIVKYRITNTSNGSGGGGDDLRVETEAPTNVSVSTARINGDLISGGPAQQVYFLVSRSQRNLSCQAFNGTPYYPRDNQGEIGSGDNPDFFYRLEGLPQDTLHYYVACANIGSDYAQGDVLSFVTRDINTGGGDDEPQATTDSARNVERDEATLRGDVDMNSFNDGLVFFVWGESEDDVEDVDREDSYGDIDRRGDDLDKEIVEDNHNGDDNFDLEVDGLDEFERYYFRICVEYYDNGDELECGSVRDFETDDDDRSDRVEIETLPPDDIGRSFAVMCGDLEDDGGDRTLRTRMEYRRANGGSWNYSSYRQRGEGRFCVRANSLREDTRYQFRACTDDGDCGNTRYFTTLGDLGATEVIANTLAPTNITASTAILNGRYQGSDDEITSVWFEWGRTAALGTRKQTFNRTAQAGNFVDSFTGLRACTTYFYRAVAQNSSGIDYGGTISFTTTCSGGGGGDIIIIEEDDDEIDLDLLGLGLNLIRLEIDNNQEAVFRDQVMVYDVEWENISTLDLDDIDVKVTLPEEVTVTNVTRGRFDADENVLFFTIDDLEDGEDGDMQISVVVTGGSLGDLITAEATAAYDNPVNDAQENATDYDADEFVLNTNFGTASVFGLSNITFLGWLTILLGLLIIFLIARWLYLEREELRAQAYARSYYPPTPYGNDPRLGGYQQPPVQQLPPYQQTPQQPLPGSQVNVDMNNGSDDGYQPYRPNRN